MKRQVWTVRIVEWFELDRDRIGLWCGEILRYAGLSRKIAEAKEYAVYELNAPPGVDSKSWAEMNAKRIQSFGINAVAAPAWEDRGVVRGVLLGELMAPQT